MQNSLNVIDLNISDLDLPVVRTVTEAGGCEIIHPEDSGLPFDVWQAVPRPSDWFIAVVAREVKETTQGGLIIPNTVRSDAETVNYVGRVIAMGPSCFKRDGFMVIERNAETGELVRALPEPRCKIGDWVIFRRHQQLLVPIYPLASRSSEDDVVIRFTDDQSILAVAQRPEQLKVYIA